MQTGYWGRYFSTDDFDEENEKPKLIWIGPLTEDEMREYYPEFRHNFKKKL